MRYLPFKILVLCVFLPPVLYVFSVKVIETSLEKNYKKQLEIVSTGDTSVLFKGNSQLQEVLQKNIEKFLSEKKLLLYGIKVTITVSVKDGRVLYPAVFEVEKKDYMNFDQISVARENFKLLNEGLKYRVVVKIEHNTAAANAILLFYVVLSVTMLQRFYRSGLKKAGREVHEKDSEIRRLKTEKDNSIATLAKLKSIHEDSMIQLEKVQNSLEEERKKSSETEDEIVEELVALEEKISNGVALYKKQEIKIADLKETISQLERDNKRKKRQSMKAVDAAKRRFATLYKNIVMETHAVSGFIDLTEEMRIKAEALIHQLNDDIKKVPIKRKVFGRKNRETVFEINFAYKGRLYFRNLNNNCIEVLAVGTKHTQSKDLAFLDKL